MAMHTHDCDVSSLTYKKTIDLLMPLHLCYGMSLAIWDHTVLPATRHIITPPTFTPAREAGSALDLSTPEGWKAELT